MDSLCKLLWLYGTSTHARQLVAVFQALCPLYRLTCVGYAQNSLQFVSCSPLIRVVSQSFCLYTDSLFAQIGDSNDKCSSSLEVVETKTKRTRYSSRRLSFNELTNAKNLVYPFCSQLTLLHGCALGERSSGGI